MRIDNEIRDSVSLCRLYLGRKRCFYSYRREKARLDALWAIRSDLRKPDAARRIKRRITGTIRNLRNLRRRTSYENELTTDRLEAQLVVFLSFRNV